MMCMIILSLFPGRPKAMFVSSHFVMRDNVKIHVMLKYIYYNLYSAGILCNYSPTMLSHVFFLFFLFFLFLLILY